MSLAMHRGSPVRHRYPNLSRSPIRNRDHRHPSPPPKKSSPHRGRSPDYHRSPPGTKSLVRNDYSQRIRSPAKRKLREHSGSPRRERSRSPAREKMSSHVRSPLKEKLPQRTKSPKNMRPRSPVNEKVSNIRRSPSHRQSRSPKKQKPFEQDRSPKQVHSRNNYSRSPSPRTKPLKQAQVEREMDKTLHSEEARRIGRERDKGRNRERGEHRDASDERRLTHEKSDGRTSRSSRHAHDRSSSPMERGHRSGHGIHSPSRASKAAARDEVTRMRGVQQHQPTAGRGPALLFTVAAWTRKPGQARAPVHCSRLLTPRSDVRPVARLLDDPLPGWTRTPCRLEEVPFDPTLCSQLSTRSDV